MLSHELIIEYGSYNPVLEKDKGKSPGGGGRFVRDDGSFWQELMQFKG
jgi:hypothetical protein